MANTSIQSCGHSKPVVRLLLPANAQPSTRGCLKAYETSHGKSRLIAFWHWHWHGELVNWYNYFLIMKSVVCHCVCVEACYCQIWSHVYFTFCGRLRTWKVTHTANCHPEYWLLSRQFGSSIYPKFMLLVSGYCHKMGVSTESQTLALYPFMFPTYLLLKIVLNTSLLYICYVHCLLESVM